MAPTSPIGRLFGRNPFTSLQEHMRVVIQCVDEVPGLFEALAQQDRAAVDDAKNRIFALEKTADMIRRDLRSSLPHRLFLPVNRRDLLEVLDMQDEIANVAQDIAGLLVERPMSIPAPMAEPLHQFVIACVAASHQAATIIEKLDELIETGFEGREANHVEEMITDLNISESETDELGLSLARLLFEHEDEMKPVSVVFWYQLIQWIGDLADYGEKTGNLLRLLIAR
jgi:predicted phosphate transport protein (TIGR00153 family)